MPILDIEVITRPGETLNHDLAVELANRAGEVFDAPPGSTWVKLRALSHESYAESGGQPPGEVFPVFVTVLTARLPASEEMKIQAARLTAAIAQACARPEANVHIVYLPDGAGHTAFGGKLVSVD